MSRFGLFFVLAICLCSTSCRSSSSGAPVIFTLPNDSRGFFKVVVNSESGVRPTPVNGAIRISVPPSGVVWVSDDAFLRVYHQESAFYQNGKRLKSELENPGSEEIGFFGLGSMGENGTPAADWWLVGTPAEHGKYLKDRKVELGLRDIDDSE